MPVGGKKIGNVIYFDRECTQFIVPDLLYITTCNDLKAWRINVSEALANLQLSLR